MSEKWRHRAYMLITLMALAVAAWDHNRLWMAIMAGGAAWFGDYTPIKHAEPK